MMKKILTYLLALLAVVLMGIITVMLLPNMFRNISFFNLQPFGRPQSGEYRCVKTVKLGDVTPVTFAKMGCPSGYIETSPSGKFNLVGTESGKILLLKDNGEILWEKDSSIDKISFMHFMDDDNILLGIEGPGCNIRCVRFQDGSVVWDTKLNEGLNTEMENRIYPWIQYISQDQQGNIYAIAQSYSFNSLHNREYDSVLYKLDPKGVICSRFPRTGTLDSCATSVKHIPGKQRVLFTSVNYYLRANNRYDKNLYCLDDGLQTELWSVSVPTIKPFRTAVIRSTPISEDGEGICFLSDGRYFAIRYDTGETEWQKRFMRAETVMGVPLNSTVVNTFYRSGKFYAVTSGSHNTKDSKLAVTVDVPAANSIFVFDRNGRVLRHIRADGLIGGRKSNLWKNSKGIALIPVGNNTTNRKRDMFGIKIIDLNAEEDITEARQLIHTEGICLSVTADELLEHIIVLTAPYKDDDGNIYGNYELRIYKKSN